MRKWSFAYKSSFLGFMIPLLQILILKVGFINGWTSIETPRNGFEEEVTIKILCLGFYHSRPWLPLHCSFFFIKGLFLWS